MILQYSRRRVRPPPPSHRTRPSQRRGIQNGFTYPRRRRSSRTGFQKFRPKLDFPSTKTNAYLWTGPSFFRLYVRSGSRQRQRFQLVRVKRVSPGKPNVLVVSNDRRTIFKSPLFPSMSIVRPPPPSLQHVILQQTVRYTRKDCWTISILMFSSSCPSVFNGVWWIDYWETNDLIKTLIKHSKFGSIRNST